jgi:hypothetical protein
MYAALSLCLFRYRALRLQDPKAEIAFMVWRYVHAKTIASSSCASIQHLFDKFGRPGPQEIAGTVNSVEMLTRAKPSQYGQAKLSTLRRKIWSPEQGHFIINKSPCVVKPKLGSGVP